MSKKHEPIAVVGQEEATHQVKDLHPSHDGKNSLLEREIKSDAGEVQEELAPIRTSANNAHKG